MKEEKNEQFPKKKKKSIFSKIPDNVKVEFFRLWFVGAIYFFIGWGTNLGNSMDPFDLVFVLAVVISFAHILIFNPIVYGMFEIERNGVIANKKYNERKIWEGALMKTLEFFHCFVVSILVYLSYELLNRWIIELTHSSEKAIPVAGEPFLYSILFLIYYVAISFIVNKSALLIKRIKEKRALKKLEKEEKKES